MKKIFTLLVIVCTTTLAFAYFEPTKLTISSFDNSSLKVMIDGNKYNNNNDDFSVTNLSAGYHNIKIYQQTKAWNKKIGYKVVYNGSIMLKPMFHTDIMINRFGKAYVDEMAMGNKNFDNNDNGWNNNDWDGMPNPITSQSFDQLKAVINNEAFDDNKLAVAKPAISSNYFTSAQVKELMVLFIRDENKLEVAKYAYNFTMDKGNYFTLNDAFHFSSSKKEFLKYLETVQK